MKTKDGFKNYKNMKTSTEKANIMLAYANGAKIESTGRNGWFEVAGEPLFNWEHNDYRVKPQPKTIPFTFEDRKLLIGRAVRDIDMSNQYVGVINECYSDSVGIGINFTESYLSLLENYVFDADSSPCGIIITE